MLYLNTLKLFFIDMKSSGWKIGLYLLFLIAGVILYANYTTFMGRKSSIPDVFNLLFQDYSLIFIVIPVFLLLLSLVLPSALESLRIMRYQSREKIAMILFIRIGSFVCLFLVFHMLCGFLYGWWLSGSLDNPWMTEQGTPYIVSDGNVNLALFNTGYMILRYAATELSAFMILGLLSLLIYLIIPRFIYAFFIVEGLVIIDVAIYSLFQVSVFTKQAEVSLGNWGDVPHFISILSYFLGLIILLCLCIYFLVKRMDFLPVMEESS